MDRWAIVLLLLLGFAIALGILKLALDVQSANTQVVDFTAIVDMVKDDVVQVTSTVTNFDMNISNIDSKVDALIVDVEDIDTDLQVMNSAVVGVADDMRDPEILQAVLSASASIRSELTVHAGVMTNQHQEIAAAIDDVPAQVSAVLSGTLFSAVSDVETVVVNTSQVIVDAVGDQLDTAVSDIIFNAHLSDAEIELDCEDVGFQLTAIIADRQMLFMKPLVVQHVGDYPDRTFSVAQPVLVKPDDMTVVFSVATAPGNLPLPSGYTFDTQTGVFSWLESGSEDSFTIVIMATGSTTPTTGARVASRTATITRDLAAPRVDLFPPVWTTPPPSALTTLFDTLVQFTVLAQDTADSNTNIGYTLAEPLAGADIDPQSGVFTWTPTFDQGATPAAQYPIEIIASDGVHTVSATCTVSVVLFGDFLMLPTMPEYVHTQTSPSPGPGYYTGSDNIFTHVSQGTPPYTVTGVTAVQTRPAGLNASSDHQFLFNATTGDIVLGQRAFFNDTFNRDEYTVTWEVTDVNHPTTSDTTTMTTQNLSFYSPVAATTTQSDIDTNYGSESAQYGFTFFLRAVGRYPLTYSLVSAVNTATNTAGAPIAGQGLQILPGLIGDPCCESNAQIRIFETVPTTDMYGEMHWPALDMTFVIRITESSVYGVANSGNSTTVTLRARLEAADEFG